MPLERLHDALSGVFWDAAERHAGRYRPHRKRSSGPGATLWGSNAVNGAVTQRHHEKRARHTGRAPERRWRILFQGVRQRTPRRQVRRGFLLSCLWNGLKPGHDTLRSGQQANDNWSLGAGAVFAPTCYQRAAERPRKFLRRRGTATPRDLNVDGQNLLFALDKPLANQVNSEFNLADNRHRRNPGIFPEALNTQDIELEHRFAVGERNKRSGAAAIG